VRATSLTTGAGIALLLLVAAVACRPADPPAAARASGTPRVDTLFHEGFESGRFGAWDDGYDERKHRIVADPALARTGQRFLDVTHPAGGDGGWLTRFLRPGYDSLYVRYFVRLEPGWVGGTKFVAFYGSRRDNEWSAFGKAGICPTGTDFFASMVVTEPEPETGHPMRFYTYYPEMRRDRDGHSCWGSYGDGTERYETPLTFSPGRWHEVAFWLRVNRPGQRDAAQRFWLDGALKGEWSGISLRASDVLRISAVQLTFSICCGGAPKTQHAYVDDVLVTTAPPPPGR